MNKKSKKVSLLLLFFSICIFSYVALSAEKRVLPENRSAEKSTETEAPQTVLPKNEQEKINTEYKKRILDIFTEYDMLSGKIREDIGNKTKTLEITEDKKRAADLAKKTSDLSLVPHFKESHLLFSRSLLILSQSLENLDYEKLEESAKLKEEALAKFWELSK